MSSSVLSARGRLGAAQRNNTPAVPDARRDLAAAKLEQYVAKVVATAPPLTSAQRDRIAALLRPVGGAA
jgi:hypothetical protein